MHFMCAMRSRFLLSIRSVRYTWCDNRVDWVDAEETIGVCKTRMKLLLRSGMGGASPRTVCVSRSKTFIAEGSETIFVMYVSTALNTSIVSVALA